MGKRWAEAFRFVGIGWYIGASILLGALGGRWVGQQLDFSSSEVIFTLLGLFLGLLVSFVGIYRMLKLIVSDKETKG
jgi:hypothetical protein